MLSFTAPHFPLQAPAEWIDKVGDRYAEGWDVIRQRRFERMQELGLAPRGMTLPSRIGEVPAWDDLSAEERKLEARKMAIYAAMVENLDHNVGRVLSLLDELGESDNTLVVFLSDNGTDPYDRNQRSIYASLRTDFGYDNSFDNLGAANSYVFYGLGWAQVGSVHHRHYKFLPSEGGMHAPMIAHLPKSLSPERPSPGVLGLGEDRAAFTSALDLAATFLDVAGVEPPGRIYRERAVHPMTGRSLLPYLRDGHAVPYGEEEPVAFEIFGHGVVFMGPWKAVRLRPPWEDSVWRLYHLADDPGEQHDLAPEQPERLAQLVAAYDAYAATNGVIEEPDDATAYPYKPGHPGDLIPAR
jgi:arylsulfatase